MIRKIVTSLLLIVSMGIMFVGLDAQEAEAAPCNPGNYAYFDENAVLNGKDISGINEIAFKCKNVDSNNSTTSGRTIEEGKYGINGLDFEGENGAGWARTFFTFLLQLAVIVGYFSEVVAMLMIAYASYIYTTSEGEPRKLRMAKMYVLYAFVGMFIGAFSLIISRFIGGAL